MTGLLKNLCAASFNAFCAAALSAAGCEVNLDIFADMDAGDALVTHLFEGVLDGFALRIKHGLLGGYDNYRFHSRAWNVAKKSVPGEQFLNPLEFKLQLVSRKQAKA